MYKKHFKIETKSKSLIQDLIIRHIIGIDAYKMRA